MTAGRYLENQVVSRKLASVRLEYLLLPPGSTPQIGPEKGRPVSDGISVFISPHGSYRYVFYSGGQAVSALQVVSPDKKIAQIANVFTAPKSRRQGLAAKLLIRARKDFKAVVHSTDLSDDGKAWSLAVKSARHQLASLHTARVHESRTPLPRLAARPIPIDKVKVSVLAKKIVQELPKHLRFRGDLTDPMSHQKGYSLNSWGFDAGNFVTQDVMERPVVVSVQVSSKNVGLGPARLRRYVTGGFVRHRGRSGEHAVKFLMGVFLDSARSPQDFIDNISQVEKEVYSVLIHEVTHLRDILRVGKGGQRRRDDSGGAYHNDPVEVRAFMQQIVDEVVDYIHEQGQAGNLWGGASMYELEGALDRSMTWNRIRRTLGHGAKKTLLKGVYTGLQDELPKLRKLYPPESSDWVKAAIWRVARAFIQKEHQQ